MRCLQLPVLLFMLCFLLPSLGAEEDSADLEEHPQSLYEKTLVKDLETAGYYELVAWLCSLDLPAQGSIESLRKALYSFYNISPESKESPSGSIITIKSAKDTDYFTIEEKGQDMVRLQGDVIVEMEESDSNRRHIIKADELIFNQSEQSITARGNLEYRMISGDYEDLFYGDSLTFSISSWNGVIFKGSSLRNEMVEGVNRSFYFNGELIRKSGSGGIFILEDGAVQTQDMENPDFHLKAQRLWLMGPKEWGIRHGILYMGHVPVLYIPFYYKPGNEMIFNPVIGSKLREGNFLQTTTYLLGRKDSSENLAFFKLGDSDEKNYELVRQGLYLMKENKQQEEEESEDTLKIMEDWYSRLGVFSGLEGRFYDKGIFSELGFSSGIGVSRTISDDNNIYFSEDSEYVSDWNSIFWGNHELPFRWGQTLEVSSTHLNAAFQFYSDPYFNQDFMVREESFDWLNTVLATQMSDDDEPDEIGDMNWNLSYSRSFSPEFLSPYIEKISLNTLKFEMDWDNKTNESEDIKYDNDPASEFFYPESVSIPYAQISLSGTPFSYSSLDGWSWNKTEKDKEADSSTDSLLPPWEGKEKEDVQEEESSDEDDSLRIAELWEPRFSDYAAVVYKNSLSYSFFSSAHLEGSTDNEEWDSPDDLEWSMEESLFETNNTFSTTFSNQFFDNVFGIVNDNDLSLNYRTHLDAMGADTSLLEYSDRLSDYQYHSISWDNDLESYSYPLKAFDDFAQSKISYNIDNLIYKKSFDSYTDGQDPVYNEDWGSWDKDDIKRHDSQLTIKYNPAVYYVTSSAQYDLPPLDRKDSYSNSCGLEIYKWKSSLSHSFYLEHEEWTVNPLVSKTSYKPYDRLTFEQDLEYDFEEDSFSKSRSYIKAWGAYASYTMEYTTPYDWDRDNLSWVSKDEAFVPSSFSTGYSWVYKKNPYWKNRIFHNSDLTLDWTVDLQQYNDNRLSFTWDYNMNIYQFMDLQLSMISSNNNMYLYIPAYRDKLGINEEYSFFGDLMKSFNILSPGQEDRYDSSFNLEKINLKLIHHLREWDLTLNYTGTPSLEDSKYVWDSEFSVFLKWNPIPQIQTDIQYEDKEWLVDTE